MEAIELEPVLVSDKEVVYRQLKANMAKTGVPRAIISDHGGDLAGGIELFRKEHPETVTFMTSRTRPHACSKPDWKTTKWNTFASLSGQTKCKIQQTEWRFWFPPRNDPRHTT